VLLPLLVLGSCCLDNFIKGDKESVSYTRYVERWKEDKVATFAIYMKKEFDGLGILIFLLTQGSLDGEGNFCRQICMTTNSIWSIFEERIRWPRRLNIPSTSEKCQL
jgi:hypothetical protein